MRNLPYLALKLNLISYCLLSFSNCLHYCEVTFNSYAREDAAEAFYLLPAQKFILTHFHLVTCLGCQLNAKLQRIFQKRVKFESPIKHLSWTEYTLGSISISVQRDDANLPISWINKFFVDGASRGICHLIPLKNGAQFRYNNRYFYVQILGRVKLNSNARISAPSYPFSIRATALEISFSCHWLTLLSTKMAASNRCVLSGPE